MKTISVYCVYDKIAERFGVPFIAPNDNLAVRNFKEFIDKNKLPVKDYVLYALSGPIVEPSCLTDLDKEKDACIVYQETEDLNIDGTTEFNK